eukprot:5990727-Karenia_brevis.AAC.1
MPWMERQVFTTKLRSTFDAKIEVRLRQGFPSMQKSVTGIIISKQRLKKEAENFARLLPTRIFSKSLVFVIEAIPHGSESLLNGIGPGLRSRALLKL